MDEKEKQALIRAVLANEAGRKVLLENPFEGLMPRRLNTGEIARKMFPIQELPPGAVPIYDKDPMRKCDECGGIFGHEPDCKLGLAEDIHES